MEALQLNNCRPRYGAGRVPGIIYEPLYGSGLSCLNGCNKVWETEVVLD